MLTRDPHPLKLPVERMQVFYVVVKPRSFLLVRGFVGLLSGAQILLDLAKNPRTLLRDTADHNSISSREVHDHFCFFRGIDVTIGDDVIIYPNVSILRKCIIGNRVSINSCSVIGSDGFGYAQDGEVHYKIPHTGIVQIDDDVEIGARCRIDSHVVINGPTRIGEENHIYQFASVGDDPQDKKYAGEPTSLVIGNRNTIREFCTISRGTVQDRGETTLGDRFDIREFHDVILGNGALPLAMLETVVEDYIESKLP